MLKLNVIICVFIIFTVQFNLYCTYSGKRNNYIDDFCRKEIPENYELYYAPRNPDDPKQPLTVYVKFKIIDFDEIDEEKMDYRLHMHFKTFWNDTRLRNTSVKVTDCSQHMWTPDVTFESAKTIQKFQAPSTSFYLNRHGRIIMTTRYAFKASCFMNFKNYPFDTQHCSFNVMFATTSDASAVLSWLGSSSTQEKSDSIELSSAIRPLQFALLQPVAVVNTNVYSYGNYTYLTAKFSLQRRLTGCVINLFVPSALVVAVSMVTFWLRPDATPARVSLSVTSLLTLCTQIHQYKSQLPFVNYLTAMDIWLFVCIAIVFGTLVEFALSYNAYMGSKIRCCKKKESEISAKSSTTVVKTDAWSEPKSRNSSPSSDRLRKQTNESTGNICAHFMKLDFNQNMDKFCRKLYPLLFIVFSFCYGAYYLSV